MSAPTKRSKTVVAIPAALPDPAQPAGITPCVACKKEIPVGASVCSSCRHYQRPWKNHIQYFAGTAAMIALLASALIWLWGNAPALLGIHHDEVRLISSNTQGSAVVVNRGDREVFVSHLILTMAGRSPPWQARPLDFEEKLPPGQFVRREFPKSKIGENAEFVRGLNALDFEKLMTRAANGDSCFELIFSVAGDNLFGELKQAAGPTLNTFPVGGYLEYLVLPEDAPVKLPVSGTGALHRERRSECG